MRKKLTVIRGSRQSVIDFYQYFEQFDVWFIAGSFQPQTFQVLKKDNFHLVNLQNYPILPLDPVAIFGQRYRNLSWTFFKDLEKYLEGSDMITISEPYYFPHLQAVLWAKKHCVPVVTVIWTTIPRHITSWFPPYAYVTKKVIEATDLFILRSNTALRFTDSLKIPREKVKVIYKGIDIKRFTLSPSRERGITILFVGNLTKAKGVDDLLFVFEQLFKKHKNIQLILAGEGELTGYIKMLSRTLPIDLKGFVPYHTLPEVYNQADIFCAPSKETKLFGIRVWEEYFSYALMEAQASGLPIVATRTGGIPEEVDDRNPLIQPGDRRALYKSLKGLILNKKKRDQLGKINRKRAEFFFDARIQAEKTEEAICEIIS